MKDLHLHLSGGTSPALLYEIINETGLKIKTKNFWDFYNAVTINKNKVHNIEEYLDVLHIIDDSQSSPRAVKMSVYNACTNCFINGCDYLELRWNPYKRSQNFKIDLDKLIISARAGFEKAKSIFKLEGGMILCLGRDVSEEANEGIFKKAIQYHKKGIIGIDVAGHEAKNPLNQNFEDFFKTANILGMTTTIHAGEQNYPGVEDTLAAILERYNPDRIGHGIQIHRFPKLMKLAARMEVLFEICITSNLVTRAVESEQEFTKIFKLFEEYQIKYTICTDATFALETNIKKEHELYERIKKLSKK